MEVTRGNFTATIPIIENALKACDFISLDTEFTGLELPDYSCSLFDNPSERYEKHKRAVHAFTLLQVGVACFKKNPEFNKYEATVFNIFVFPSSFGKYSATFTAQISAVDFLCQNRFDFNKFAYEGVPFLNRHNLEQVRTALELGLIDHNEIGISSFSDWCQILAGWLKSAVAGDTTEIDVSDIGIGSGIARWVFEYELLRIFPRIRIKSSDALKMVVQVSYIDSSPALRADHCKTLLQKVLDELRGCSVLFDMLVNAKKPIVGQNLLLDLMFFYEKFYDQLPDKYEVFKSRLGRLLREIYDTKQVAVSMRKQLEEVGCKSFRLSGLYNFFEGESGTKHTVAGQPHVTFAEGCKKYEIESHPHEAAYDAYMCGLVFIRLAHMKAMQTPMPRNGEQLTYHRHIEALRPFVNRASLVNAAVNYVNLSGDDPTSLRPDWLLVTTRRLFQKLDRFRLVADFARFGTFDVRPVSADRALIAVASHSAAQAMIDSIQKSDTYAVRRYSGSVPSSFGKMFAIATALVAISFVASAWTWKAVTGRSPIKT